MKVITHFNYGDIVEWYDTRLTRRIFKIIQENLIYEAMTSDGHDAVANVTVCADGNTSNSRYIITADAWQEISKVYGELNVFKESLDNLPIYTRTMILAE